jgi:hypothetical protein
MISQIRRLFNSPIPAMAITFAAGLWGIRWGLPSADRAQLFLRPELRNQTFYAKLAQARNTLYEQIGTNPIAHYGRVVREGQSQDQPISILSVYGSFLVRTHHGDEQQTVVMLSRLNPLKGRWYPETFQYGGAYVYSLAAYLGALHVFHLIRLTPDSTFYYAHPDKMGDIFTAIRIWSLIALICSLVPLYQLGKRLIGPTAAAWTSILYALIPTNIANAKIAKPHVWASVWTLTAIFFSLQSKEDRRIRSLTLASVALGLAVGTTLSQSLFVVFLIWACWDSTAASTIRRLALAGCVSLATFFLTNFYIFNHFADFRDELYFLQHWYPFGVRFGALWEFASKMVWASCSWPLALVAMAGTIVSIHQRDNYRLRQIAVLSCLVFVLVSFQNQSQLGDPVTSRLCLSLLALWIIGGVGWLQRHRRGIFVLTICLLALCVTASFYDAHFQSDRVPRDNATRTARWITQNVSPKGTIGIPQAVPNVYGFPPIDFDRYQIRTIGNPEFLKTPQPQTVVMPLWAPANYRDWLTQNGFIRTHYFADSPIQRLGFHDPFTTANFPLEIYEHKQ